MVLSSRRARIGALLTALVVLATAAPALAYDAKNADKVDGKHAVSSTSTASRRRNKLVAASRKGFLPNNIIKMAPNSSRLGGRTLAQVIASATDVYTPGAGLGLELGQFSLLPGFQLPQDCAADEVVQLDAPGDWGCVALGGGSVAWGDLTEVPAGFADNVDNDTVYDVGHGLALEGGTTLVVDFNEVAAESHSHDGIYAPTGHDHDGRYFTKSELQNVGGINTPGNPVDWSKLKNVPAGFADGVDTDTNTTYSPGTGLNLGGTTFAVDTAEIQSRVTGICAAGSSIRSIDATGSVVCETDDNAAGTTYTAGAGLDLTGTTFSVIYDGSGTLDRAARSDHDHDATYWKQGGNAGTSPGIDSIGTTDDQPFEIKVFGGRVLRLEPNGTSPNIVTGSSSNSVFAGAFGATVAGGGTFFKANRVTDTFGTVGGGEGNRAGDNGGTLVDARHATVGGGQENTSAGMLATIGGGYSHTASAIGATIGGGYNNSADAQYSTIAGGFTNSTSGGSSFIGGGSGNSTGADSAGVAAGGGNAANGAYSFVGAGQNNTTTGSTASVLGGAQNTAAGQYGAVLGGRSNDATGAASLAAGTRATAQHDKSFVWGDADGFDTVSPAANTFSVSATNGVWFGINNVAPAIPAGRFINTHTGAHLTTGGAWTNASDVNLKRNFVPVDGIATLETLSQMPIATWSYKAEDGVLHMGPTAQDFKAAFGLGSDDKSITTVDADGVALSAIQGLYELVQDQQAQIDRLERLVLRRGAMNSVR